MKLKEFLEHITVQSIIALTIIAGGLSLIAFADLGERTEGAIENMIILVLGYYFGSSRSTAKKDKTIEDLSKDKALK